MPNESLREHVTRIRRAHENRRPFEEGSRPRGHAARDPLEGGLEKDLAADPTELLARLVRARHHRERRARRARVEDERRLGRRDGRI